MEKINNLGIEKKFLSMIKFRRHKKEHISLSSKDQIFPHGRKLQIESKLKS